MFLKEENNVSRGILKNLNESNGKTMADAKRELAKFKNKIITKEDDKEIYKMGYDTRTMGTNGTIWSDEQVKSIQSALDTNKGRLDKTLESIEVHTVKVADTRIGVTVHYSVSTDELNVEKEEDKIEKIVNSVVPVFYAGTLDLFDGFDVEFEFDGEDDAPRYYWVYVKEGKYLVGQCDKDVF